MSKPMVAIKDMAPETIARIKLRYEARAVSVHDIALEEGVTPWQIHEMRRQFRWPTRTELGKRVFQRSIEQEREISAALAEIAPGAAPEDAPAGATIPARDPKGRFAAKPENFDVRALALRVQGALERELSAGQAQIDERTAAGAESRARTLSTLARALQTVQSIAGNRSAGEADADEPPLDIAELRRELIRRIHRIRDEREGEIILSPLEGYRMHTSPLAGLAMG